MQDRERDTDVYNGLLDSEGEGEGGMNWENGIVTCIPYKEEILMANKYMKRCLTSQYQENASLNNNEVPRHNHQR